MTTSPLKFELIDGSESTTQERQTRPRDPFKTPVKPQPPQKTQTLRASIMPAVLDPSLLHDLAEGLEFLNRQLDDAESELVRSRQQTLILEQDARRWESESTRLRSEADEARQTLDEITQEMAEVRVSNTHLEKLVGEQQRALVLSLELLKRLKEESEAQPSSNSEETAALLAAKDQEIANLKRLVVAAGEEGTRVDEALAHVRAEHQSAQSQIEALQSELATAEAELAASRSQLESRTSEFSKLREELNRLEALPRPETQPDADLTLRLAELKEERIRTAQKLQDAEAEITLQNAEVESRGAIIIALENTLEEQTASLRTLEERFLAYAEQVQTIQIQRLETPQLNPRNIASTFAKIFSPPKRARRD